MTSINAVCVTCAVLLVVSGREARAQDHGRGGSTIDSGVVLGATAGALLMGETRIDAVGLRVGVPVRRQTQFELGMDLLIRTSYGGRTTGSSGLYYFLQGRQTFTTASARYAVFGTFGAGGWVERDTGSFTLPILPHLGVGAQVPIGSRVAVRVDAQAILGVIEDTHPFTARISGGIAVPLGRAQKGGSRPQVPSIRPIDVPPRVTRGAGS